MALLRMRDASFANATVRAGPVTLDLEAGGRVALTFLSSQEATIVALMAAGIAKATTGSVLIGDYDPRVQSVHCKRIAGFVPHEPLQLDEGDFPRYIAYRAALWNVEATAAQADARLLCERLEGMHEAFAFPLIGALIATPRLIVLDRPQHAYAAQILRAVEGRALLSTHAPPSNAAAFA
jgi:ABC-type sulfate/molybdate transport systems ATPase subunit